MRNILTHIDNVTMLLGFSVVMAVNMTMFSFCLALLWQIASGQYGINRVNVGFLKITSNLIDSGDWGW